MDSALLMMDQSWNAELSRQNGKGVRYASMNTCHSTMLETEHRRQKYYFENAYLGQQDFTEYSKVQRSIRSGDCRKDYKNQQKS